MDANNPESNDFTARLLARITDLEAHTESLRVRVGSLETRAATGAAPVAPQSSEPAAVAPAAAPVDDNPIDWGIAQQAPKG